MLDTSGSRVVRSAANEVVAGEGTRPEQLPGQWASSATVSRGGAGAKLAAKLDSRKYTQMDPSALWTWALSLRRTNSDRDPRLNENVRFGTGRVRPAAPSRFSCWRTTPSAGERLVLEVYLTDRGRRTAPRSATAGRGAVEGTGSVAGTVVALPVDSGVRTGTGRPPNRCPPACRGTAHPRRVSRWSSHSWRGEPSGVSARFDQLALTSILVSFTGVHAVRGGSRGLRPRWPGST